MLYSQPSITDWNLCRRISYSAFGWSTCAPHEPRKDCTADRCRCGKGRMSFPHWPPTSFEEAVAQYEMCLEKGNRHRRYLAYSWWSFINNFATMEPWTIRKRQKRYQDGEKEIRQRCPTVTEELDKCREPPVRPKGWRCYEFCEPILKERKCSCLCHCRHHRDECPVHLQ
jgi:hypothetical protein